MAQNRPTDKNRNPAFFRLSNLHISASLRRFSKNDPRGPLYGFSSLGDLALYAMIGTILSNPAFTYAAGGLQNLLLRHTKNRYFSLHGAIRRLGAAGYLQRTRIPEGTNCFHDYYTLSHTQKMSGTAHPSASCLTAEQGKAFRSSYRPYLPPTEDYTEVSIPMLMDPNLSLGAKGLYIVIARYLRLQSYKPDLSLTKDMLRGMCREGANAFDRMFRELRTCGYLVLTRCKSPKTGYPGYRYSLNKTPDTVSVSSCCAQKQPVSEEPVQSAPSTAPNSTPKRAMNPENTVPAEVSVSALRRQIEYDCLREEYAAERLDCIISIMQSFFRKAPPGSPPTLTLAGVTCTREEVASRFSELDSEDIRFVLDNYNDAAKTTKIRSIRGYLTACLFHAKENLALALDAFAIRTPGTVPV